jgi:hypothetical protein
MLVIRNDQFAVLGHSALENRLLAHIEAHFPVHRRVVGRTALVEVIRLGEASARKYALTTQREVCLFVGLMLYFGSAFDTDFQLPWMGRHLSDAREPNPFARILKAHAATIEYVRRVAGPSGSYMRAAILRLIKQENAAGDLEQRLESLYPEKMRELSDAARAALLGHAATLARTCRLDDGGMWLCAALSLLLGHGFYDDPQHQWAAAVLNKADESTRVSALADAAAVHLPRWFEEET